MNTYPTVFTEMIAENTTANLNVSPVRSYVFRERVEIILTVAILHS